MLLLWWVVGNPERYPASWKGRPASVRPVTVPRMDHETRVKLDFSTRVQVLHGLYHQACGEAIQFRLAFRDAPEIDVTEDLATLVLRPGSPGEQDRATIRAWIEERVDVSRLRLSRRHSAALLYWRGAGDAMVSDQESVPARLDRRGAQEVI